MATNKKTAKKAAAKTAAKPAKKAAPKKSAPKAAAKKAPPKKATAKKSPTAKKTTEKKVAPQKAAAKKPAPKKVAPQKSAVKKVAPAKAAPKKAAPEKSKAPTKQPPKPVERLAAEPPKKKYIPDVTRPTGMYGGVLIVENPKPFPKKSPYTKVELDGLRVNLTSEKGRLRSELSQLEEMAFGENSGGDLHGHSMHMAEHASDLAAKENSYMAVALVEERLNQVEEALDRLDSRSQFGLCVACGEKVGIDRLKTKPHAHLCIDCRRIYEKERRKV